MSDVFKYSIRIDLLNIHEKIYRKLDLNPEMTIKQMADLIAVLFNDQPSRKFTLTNSRDKFLFTSDADSKNAAKNKLSADDTISVLEDAKLCPSARLYFSFPDPEGWCFEAHLEKVKTIKRKTPDRLSLAKGIGLFRNITDNVLLDGTLLANPSLAAKLTKEQLGELTRRVNTLCPSLSLACTGVKAGEKLDENKLLQAYRNMTYQEGKQLHRGYIFHVLLRGSRPSSSRQFFFSAQCSINFFIRSVLRGFDADLMHLYSLSDMYGRDILVCESGWGDEFMGDPDMSLDDLVDDYGTQFLLVYDFGDDWQFIVTVQGEALHTLSDALLNSKGEGIIEDCGGIWALNEIRSDPDLLREYFDFDDWDEDDEDEGEDE